MRERPPIPILVFPPDDTSLSARAELRAGEDYSELAPWTAQDFEAVEGMGLPKEVPNVEEAPPIPVTTVEPAFTGPEVLFGQAGEVPTAEPLFSYLAGTAGTGKSTLARQRAELANPPDAILCATTGIAAVNLGGVTINSTLKYYDSNDLQTKYELGQLNQAIRKLVGSGFRRLIIDEISMMDGRQLTILCTSIDEVNEWARKEGEPEFGLTLVGDFAQLPPVKAEFAFQSPCWPRFEEHTTLLTEPRRQADPDFVRALQQVRRGDKTAVEYFRPFIGKIEDRNFDGTTILAKNDEVDRYNKIRMLDLKVPEVLFQSYRGGEHQPSEWKHIPDRLAVKQGCLIMVLANRYEGDSGARSLIYCNGDLGHYEGREMAEVYDSDGDMSEVEVANIRLIRTGDVVQVMRVRREKTTATGAKGVKAPREEKEGWIEYMPLRVAYASTVHKSQGLSLDKVQLMINSHFWIQAGMIYVGLSRCRTPQGLRIVGTVDQFTARIRANGAVQRWL